MAEAAEGLRERTRRAVKSELVSVGMDLFVEHGYDEITIEQIACAGGLSKRSFFRYFASKEDLVLGGFERIGQRLARKLVERPDDEPAWLALRRSFDYLVELNNADPQRSLLLYRMLHETPALKAGQLEKQSRWRELLAPPLARHLPAAEFAWQGDPRAYAIVAAALACHDSALVAWVANDAKVSLHDLIDATMSAVAPLTATP
ncbi:TetR/AcrR family transcriptional regulator [Jatrophihabitans sp. DSM 45814]